MPRTNRLFVGALLAASLGGAGVALAQSPQAPRQDMPHAMPMQGMMGQQGQGGTTQGGCPMMQRSAALERRVRQLEERLGIPPAPPQPSQPGSPG